MAYTHPWLSLRYWFTTALVEKDNKVKGESKTTGDKISKATRHSVCEREGKVEIQNRITTSQSVPLILVSLLNKHGRINHWCS